MGRKAGAKRKGASKTLPRLKRRMVTDTALYRLRASHALRDLLLASLSGVMVFLSYPTYDLWPLQWVSLLPLLWVIRDKTPWRAFAWGFWSGLITNWGGFYWVTGMLMDFGHFSLTLAIPLCMLLCAYQGLVFAIWAGLTRWTIRRSALGLLWVSPVVWVVVEYTIPFIFPWYMANGQYLFYPAIQITEVTGVMGLSFLLVFVNTGLFLGLLEATSKRWKAAIRPTLFAVGLFALNVIYGVIRMHQVDEMMESAATLKIGVGEADVGIWEKEARNLKTGNQQLAMMRGNILKHQLLSAELEQEHQVDLIVEPESSFIPVPAGVAFKRSDLFVVAAGRGSKVWLGRDEAWSGPQRVEKGLAAINGLSAAREEHVFAVGDGGAVFKMQGERWVREESGVQENLYSVWATEASPDDFRLDGAPIVAMAVGAQGTALLRENGQWIKTDTRTSATLHGVLALGSRIAFAVGDRGTIRRWDGLGWKRESANTDATLRALWFAPSGEVIVVGDRGTVLTRESSVWKKATLGSKHLRGVSGNVSGAVLVGDGGVAYRRKGTKWHRMKTGVSVDLHAVAADGRSDMYAVGDRGVVLRLPRAEDSWTQVTGLRQVGALRAVTGLPYTEASRAYPRDVRYVSRSRTPLPPLERR